MWPFNTKPSSVLGIDIGSSAVKMVELAMRHGRPTLLTYGFAEFSEMEQQHDLAQHPERAGAIVKQLLARAGATSRRAVASLPTYSVFSSVVHLPPISKKEQGAAVKREAAKLIRQPIEEMLVNWETLPELPAGMQRPTRAPVRTPAANDVQPAFGTIPDEKKKETSMHVLVTAAEKKLVGAYTAMFTAAGVTLASLETEAFALARALVGNDKSIAMIVDMGATNTDIIVVDGGVPVLNRSIAFGGASCTAAFATSLGLQPTIAEQVKRDMSGGGQRHAGVVATAMAPLIQKTLTPLVNEIQYIRGLYPPPSTGKRIEKIILTGGTAWLDHAIPYITERFNTTTTIGDPWARVEVPAGLAPALDELGPRLSVAIGLAMRELIY